MRLVKVKPSSPLLLLVSLGMVFSSATAFAARDFLDDANTRGPSNGSAPSINKHDFPRIFSHEFTGGMTAEQAGNFMFLDAHGTQFGKMQQAQQMFSPDTMLIRHISGRAYQQGDEYDLVVIDPPPLDRLTHERVR